jgi:hypothetical protein
MYGPFIYELLLLGGDCPVKLSSSLLDFCEVANPTERE